jgi:ferric-dicitrate binding protein FerR (iron transport regulator)
MMNCQEMKKCMESWLEGSLDDRRRQELQVHLRECEHCRQEFEPYRKLETVLREAFTFPRSDQQAADSVMAKLPNYSAPTLPRPVFSFAKIAAGFLLAAGLAVGFYAGRQSMQRVWLHAAATSYQIRQLEGTVLVRHENSDLWTPLRADSKIYAGDQFLSTPQGRVCFSVDADSFIDLSENSMLVLQSTGDQTDLHLVHGSLNASLKSPHGPFFVTTPHGRAEAMGTEFSVTIK